MQHTHETIRDDYNQTVAYFYSLQDVRFKLLSLVPSLTGLAIALVARDAKFGQQLALAVFGAAVVLGITFYDQRNTQIYDRLVRRARFLEASLGMTPLPGDRHGGPFFCRPPLRASQPFKWLRSNRPVLIVWHTAGLATVYGAAFAAWVYLGANALLHLTGLAFASLVAVLPASAAFGIYVYTLVQLSTLNHMDNHPVDVFIDSLPSPVPQNKSGTLPNERCS